MTCPHCKCQTYMNPCPQCGENTNRPNYAGYSQPAQRRVAIEFLERWEAQMEDLVRSGCFGIHIAEGCTACRAGHLIQGMADFRRILERAPCLPNSVLDSAGHTRIDSAGRSGMGGEGQA